MRDILGKGAESEEGTGEEKLSGSCVCVCVCYKCLHICAASERSTDKMDVPVSLSFILSSLRPHLAVCQRPLLCLY